MALSLPMEVYVTSNYSAGLILYAMNNLNSFSVTPGLSKQIKMKHLAQCAPLVLVWFETTTIR